MIRLALVVLVIASVAYLVVELLRAPAQEELGFTDPPSYLDDLDTDEGTPW